MLEEDSGLLRVEVTDERKWGPFEGLMAFDRFGYDGYYASYAPRIDENSDSFTVRFSDVDMEKAIEEYIRWRTNLR
ncbi:hypothetical protein [Thermococcus stetteri]|uniref:hypothetical protein n=1 Tax=Thermococcus stetteri TaxID=49900 RepID=UPI001AE0F8D2|nr:hypothetical protein [Thermococcus stetteri]MBP1912210.1 hypothetical protein [Thermococcus stetteri]